VRCRIGVSIGVPLQSSLVQNLESDSHFFKKREKYYKILNFTITNWRLLSSLHTKPPRILGGHSTKIEKF